GYMQAWTLAVSDGERPIARLEQDDRWVRADVEPRAISEPWTPPMKSEPARAVARALLDHEGPVEAGIRVLHPLRPRVHVSHRLPRLSVHDSQGEAGAEVRADAEKAAEHVGVGAGGGQETQRESQGGDQTGHAQSPWTYIS